MAYGEAEDAGGLAPAKDNNETGRHFVRRTLTIFECVDYIIDTVEKRQKGGERKWRAARRRTRAG